YSAAPSFGEPEAEPPCSTPPRAPGCSRSSELSGRDDSVATRPCPHAYLPGCGVIVWPSSGPPTRWTCAGRATSGDERRELLPDVVPALGDDVRDLLALLDELGPAALGPRDEAVSALAEPVVGERRGQLQHAGGVVEQP